MLKRSDHPTDEELLLFADGELPDRQAARMQAHFRECWGCRARMAETEEAIAAFTRDYRRNGEGQVPPISGPRALLKARLSELSAKSEPGPWRNLVLFRSAAATIGAMVLAAVLMGTGLLRHERPQAESASPARVERVVPDRLLTPGATRAVTMNEVCSTPHEEVSRKVSAELRRRVYREYGIGNAGPDEYEIDYLIAPRLGGVDDIRNLWPEPYTSTWNAHVKDALEERLHGLVCAGELDLPTAQRDIATDWIGAYKKYFHSEVPRSLG